MTTQMSIFDLIQVEAPEKENGGYTITASNDDGTMTVIAECRQYDITGPQPEAAPAETPAEPSEPAETAAEQPVTVSYNQELNGIEITFTAKPDEKTRTELKNAGFRWHKVKKLWYAKSTADRLELADRIAAEAAEAEKPLIIPPAESIVRGGLYDGWKGGNRSRWSTDQELKALLTADFKKARIPATTRFGRSGYCTSLTVTIKITPDEIVPFETFRETYKIPASGWLHYTDDDNSIRDIFAEEFWRKDQNARSEMTAKICRAEYNLAMQRLTSYGQIDTGIVTPAAAAKYKTAQKIVNSYNRDCSNSMVDYFDRSIYDSYRFKIA